MYSRDHALTASLPGGASIFSERGVNEEKLLLHAGGSIVGMEFKPAWATCSIVGAVRARSRFDAAPVTLPVADARDAGPVDPMQCAPALLAAKQSLFQTAIAHCRPVPIVDLFELRFYAQ